MNDRRRYRLNAAECLSVASTSDSDYRSLLLCIATSWLALAREQETTRDLLVSWGMAAHVISHSSTLTTVHTIMRPSPGSLRGGRVNGDE
jgi:hypothetical protein